MMAGSVISTLFCIALGFIWYAGVTEAFSVRFQRFRWIAKTRGCVATILAGWAFLGWMIYLSWAP